MDLENAKQRKVTWVVRKRWSKNTSNGSYIILSPGVSNALLYQAALKKTLLLEKMQQSKPKYEMACRISYDWVKMLPLLHFMKKKHFLTEILKNLREH